MQYKRDGRGILIRTRIADFFGLERGENYDYVQAFMGTEINR